MRELLAYAVLFVVPSIRVLVAVTAAFALADFLAAGELAGLVTFFVMTSLFFVWPRVPADGAAI